MKLASFDQGHGPEIAIVTDRGLVPLTKHKPALGGDMIKLIGVWPEARAELEDLAAALSVDCIALDQVRLLAPVRRPGKIMAIGLNYAEHVSESRDHIGQSGMPKENRQLWFAKMSSSVTGPYDPVQMPKVSTQIDFEAEMIAIIGSGGRHISRANAAEAIFGYCVGNDATSRDWQLASPQWTLGKSFDTHAPFGPWITTSDEVDDPHVLDIRAWVNGELRQNSNTRHMIFDVFAQVEHLSQAMTLEAGDVLFTGTPAGVGMADGRYLHPGDRVRIEVEKLGAIENPFEPE